MDRTRARLGWFCVMVCVVCALAGAPAAVAQDTKANEGGDLAFGGGGRGPGQFAEMRDITFDAAGNLYVLEGTRLDRKTNQAVGNLRVQKFSKDGSPLSVIDLRDSATGQALGEKNDPQRLAADAAGNVYVTQPQADRAQQFGPDGKFVRSYDVPRARAISICPRDGREVVAVIGSAREVVKGKGWTWLRGDRIVLIDPRGGPQSEVALPRAYENVLDLTADRAGNFYVKAEPNAVYKLAPDGKELKVYGGNPTTRNEDGSELLHTVAVDSKGNVYSMTWGNPGLVTRFDANGQTVTQRGGQFKWADMWSEHSGYVPLAVDPDDRLWAGVPLERPPTAVHYSVKRPVPAVVRTRPDFFENPPGSVRVTPLRMVGFKPSLACALPYNVSYETGRPVPMSFVVAASNRAVSGVTVRWRALDAMKTEVAAGQFDLSLENGKEARAEFAFAPPRFGAYLVLATMSSPQGDLGGVGEHVAVTPRFPNMPVLEKDQSPGGWNDVARQLWTGLPNVRIHPGKDDKALAKTDQEIAAAEKAGITFLVQLVDNMKNLTPEHVRRVVTRYKGRVKYYEVCNEPNFSSKPDEYFAGHKMAWQIVKEVDPQAKVMGPATVNLNLEWLARLYELGFKDVSDIISLHDYEGHESITPEHWAWKFGEVRKVMARYGDAAKPVWQTERAIAGVRGGNFMGLVQAIRCTLHRDLLETLGVPSEHNNHYYLNQAGYSAVPSYVWSKNGPHPTAATLRARHAVTGAMGRTFAGTVDFGPTGNTLLLGARYGTADGQTIALRNLGSPPMPLEFGIRGGSETVQVMDAWGNTDNAPVREGKVKLWIGQLPAYLLLGPGQRLTPPRLDFGTNVAAKARWEYSAKLEKGEDALLANGVYETFHNANPNGDTNGAKIWTGELPLDAAGAIVPQALVASFEAPQAVDKVIVRGVRADNTFCALLEYDLDGFDGQAWRPIERVRNAMPPSEPARTADARAATWMDDTNLYVHRFAPLTVQKLRITVRRVSYGFVPDDRTQARGKAIPPKFMLREVEIFAPAP